MVVFNINKNKSASLFIPFYKKYDGTYNLKSTYETYEIYDLTMFKFIKYTIRKESLS